MVFINCIISLKGGERCIHPSRSSFMMRSLLTCTSYDHLSILSLNCSLNSVNCCIVVICSSSSGSGRVVVVVLLSVVVQGLL